LPHVQAESGHDIEGAKFWPGVLTELKNRGVREVLIACVDGLKGFPQSIGRLWNDNQERVILFLRFPPEIRRAIHTTNAVESLHMSLRKSP
jgi:transposase-like protein